MLGKPSGKNATARVFLRWSFGEIINCSKYYVSHAKTSVRHFIDSCSSLTGKITHTTGTVVRKSHEKFSVFASLSATTGPKTNKIKGWPDLINVSLSLLTNTGRAQYTKRWV